MGNSAARLNVRTTSTRSRTQAVIARVAHVGRECAKKAVLRYAFCISNLRACEFRDLRRETSCGAFDQEFLPRYPHCWSFVGVPATEARHSLAIDPREDSFRLFAVMPAENGGGDVQEQSAREGEGRGGKSGRSGGE